MFKIRNVFKKHKSDECSILLFMKNNNITVSVNWNDDFDSQAIGTFIGAIATGELLELILQETSNELKDQGREEEIETVYETIKVCIDQHKKTTFDDDEPIVQPVNAINRQLTMYQPNQG